MLVKFLYPQDVVFIVVVRVDVADIELSVLQYDEYAVCVIEFSEEVAMILIVDAVDIRVEPYFPSTQCGVAVTLQPDTMDRLLCQQVALRGTTLDE